MELSITAKYGRDMTNLMTREQAAGALHLSLSTVTRMCKDGELEVVRPRGAGRGRPLFITAESVNRALTPVRVTKTHAPRACIES